MFSGWCFTSNNAWHKGGRITVSWNPNSFDVNIIKCTSQLIHLFVETIDKKIFLTFVYGFNDEIGRRKLWADLREIASTEAWVVLGDFNDILNKEERIGTKVKYKNSSEFRDCVDDCHLEDVKFVGSFFTWCNKQLGDERIYSKIDRVLANPIWLDEHPNAEVVFQNEGLLDHSPAVLAVSASLIGGKKSFKNFRIWSSHPEYNKLIRDRWMEKDCGTKMFQIVTKLKGLKPKLKQLNHQYFADILAAHAKAKMEIDDCQKELHKCPLNVELQVREAAARTEFATIQAAYLSFLQQKAKILWLKDGTPIQPFTTIELVGEDVFEAITSFLHSGKLLREVKNTVLTLVPKSKCPNTVGDYRPIACCNVLYKAATKLICSRLKLVLPDLISRNQSGFVQGRFIGHNIMVCQDLIRHYGRNTSKANCMIKLDLQKAYDTVEWDFIEEMLVAFKFSASFVELIMVCVRTPKFSLMFNGSLHGYFESKRGLRQGDPMSPLLFVLGMEYLSRIMRKVGLKQDFKFHERCGELKLNHLSFADDVLLFCNGDYKSIYLMLQGLELFSQTSGLKPNPSKTAVYCNNMCDVDVQRILDASGFSKQEVPFKYLGVPICPKKLSAKQCDLLVEKMVGRIRTWSSRNLSFAGRTVLINSVLMAIHSYWSQIMVLPKIIIKDIEAICRGFLWSGTHQLKGVAAVAWSKVCHSKSVGGLGLKSVGDWNIAAMFKYVWAVAKKEDNLWVKWVHCVYIKEADWWQYNASANDSEKKHWSSVVWSRLNCPKHSFIFWLTILQRLKTKDRVKSYNPHIDPGCVLCNNSAEESVEHLFFACSFTRECFELVKQWLGWRTSAKTVDRIVIWLGKTKGSKFKRAVFAAAFAALIYQVWCCRNGKLWEGKEGTCYVIFQQVQSVTKSRISCIWPKKVSNSDKTWCHLARAGSLWGWQAGDMAHAGRLGADGSGRVAGAD
ncbi:uncharacterized protein LOC115710551 [Cannabis sativa]|uniref:uncharacterized protein LOC115710551 n=1 Tax=Cannabis sativa TaxID=3483 RepID=UPI0029C9F6BF|nr:uncharacterized protein LOC115710551 [Cannabis sativa]